MSPIAQYPTFEEWCVEIQADPTLAKEHLKHLRRQAAMHGALVPPEIQFSIDDYQRAYAKVTAAGEPGATAPTGALLAPYPDEAGWRELLTQDPAAAQQQIGDLKRQLVTVGQMRVPFAVQASIDAYNAAHRGLETPAPPEADSAPTKRPWWKRLFG
jgi:hypothetical protein